MSQRVSNIIEDNYVNAVLSLTIYIYIHIYSVYIYPSSLRFCLHQSGMKRSPCGLQTCRLQRRLVRQQDSFKTPLSGFRQSGCRKCEWHRWDVFFSSSPGRKHITSTPVDIRGDKNTIKCQKRRLRLEKMRANEFGRCRSQAARSDWSD